MEANPFFEKVPEEIPSFSTSNTNAVHVWEYKLFIRDLELDNTPGADELNPLGSEGWELVTMFVHANMLYCYFKRQK